HARRRAARAAGESVKIECVRGEGDCFAQRADQRPGIASVCRLVLTRGDEDAALWMRKRCVVDVLTDVVLIHAHRAVGSERDILSTGQVELLYFRRGVPQQHVPEPDWGIVREREGDLVFDALPRAASGEPAAGLRRDKSRRARRAEKRGPGRLTGPAPQEEIGGATLELATEEEAEGRRAAVEAAHAAAPCDLGANARAAADDSGGGIHDGYRSRIPRRGVSRCGNLSSTGSGRCLPAPGH